MWKILGILFFGGQMNLKCSGQTSPTKASSIKSSSFRTRKSSLSEDTHPPTPTFRCLHESQWLIVVLCLKSLRNNFLFLSGSEHRYPFKQQVTGLAQESSLKTSRAAALSSPGHSQETSQCWARGR